MWWLAEGFFIFNIIHPSTHPPHPHSHPHPYPHPQPHSPSPSATPTLTITTFSTELIRLVQTLDWTGRKSADSIIGLNYVVKSRSVLCLIHNQQSSSFEKKNFITAPRRILWLRADVWTHPSSTRPHPHKWLTSVFLIKHLMESDEWGVESVELVEYYMEPSLILLEPACEPIVMGFSRIFSFFRCFFCSTLHFSMGRGVFSKSDPGNRYSSSSSTGNQDKLCWNRLNSQSCRKYSNPTFHVDLSHWQKTSTLMKIWLIDF